MLKRLVLLLVVAAAIGAWFVFDLGHDTSFDYLQAQRGALLDYRHEASALPDPAGGSAAARGLRQAVRHRHGVAPPQARGERPARHRQPG